MTDQLKVERGKTLPEMLAVACDQWPDHVFLDFSGEKLTYSEFDRKTDQLARGLSVLGVGPGARVSALLDNVLEFVLVWFAANKVGAIFVPINTDMKGEFLRHQLSDADGAITVCEAHYADRIFAIENDLPADRTLLVRGAVPEGSRSLQVRSLESCFVEGPSIVRPDATARDIAMLIYTSGTTGPSKGCMVSHNYAISFGTQTGRAAGITHDDIVWTPCPLFHSAGAFGVIVNALIRGATASVFPRFSVSKFWPEIERSGATATLILSTMLTMIPAQPESAESERCHGQLRVVWGAPLNNALIKSWKQRFGVRHVATPGYGSSEATLIIFNRAEAEIPDGASGRRFEDFDVRIVDDAGYEVPVGVAGEIIVRPMKPDIMFQGYWRRPEATVAAFRDLWFWTGDVGKFDENGFFYFVDRKKDYLRRGGENISSFEVEAAFLKHPAIAEAAIHAVKSDQAEDEVKLTAVLKSGATVSEQDLCRWCIDQIPHFAVPRFIEYSAQLPRTPSGRVQKYLLQKAGVTAGTWDRKTSDIVLQRGRTRG